ADLNAIFGKNTERQFSFDPATGVEFYTTPYGGGLCYPVTQNHDYLVQITKTALEFSNGGNGGCNFSEATDSLVAFNLNWTRIYSRREIEHNNLKSLVNHNDYYVNQLGTMAHELGHLHGLGVGEYYSLGGIADQSGALPLISTSTVDPSDIYWGTRGLVLRDPMFSMYTDARTTDAFTFSPLSATLINKVSRGETNEATCGNPYLGPINCFDISRLDPEKRVTVQVLDKDSRQPLTDCRVSAFRRYAVNDSYLIADSPVDLDGRATFSLANDIWHWSMGNVAFFKTSCPGHSPAGDLLSTFDLQAGLYMPGGGASGDFHYDGNLEIYTPVGPETGPEVTFPFSFTSPTEGQAFTERQLITLSTKPETEQLTSLTIYADGQEVCTVTQAPYECQWEVTRYNKKNPFVYIYSIASDAANRYAYAQVTINVLKK
ncbi:MAG TPA: Ig-like domain-containing protein, partial [Verrucomicrobiae bacterium]|nr:Ig-like domain-containing protein [Verrucomicrobiae bacterium]